MNLAQLTAVLANAGAGAAQEASQLALVTARGLEATVHARRNVQRQIAKAAVLQVLEDGVLVGSPQRYGVYQEQAAFSLDYQPQLLSDAAQQMADQLAAAAAGLITGPA